MNKFEFKNLTPFKWFVLENFPFIEADFDALTEWQLFCKLGKEMNKIINSENILGNQVENMTNAFIELQNYVNNYFDNLDVQEEINNKLNQMVEDGTLPEIISSYLNSKAIFGFNNVANMKEATNLINGSYAKTLGYYNKNDGGKSLYKIRTKNENDIIDEMFILDMNKDNLIAELIYNNEVNTKQLGIKGDNQTDVTSLFQKAIDILSVNGGTLNINDGIYMVNGTQSVYMKSNVNLNFNNAKLKCIPQEDSHYQILYFYNSQNNIINNAVIEGERNEHLGEDGEFGYGVYVRGNSHNIHFNNLTVRNCWGDGVFFYRLRIGEVDYIPSHVFFNGTTYIENCRRQGVSMLAGEHVYFDNLICKDINGTLPMAGIDLESEHSVDLLGDIHINYLKCIGTNKCFTLRNNSKITGNITIGTIEQIRPIKIKSGDVYDVYLAPFIVHFNYFDKSQSQYNVSVNNIIAEEETVIIEDLYNEYTPRVTIDNIFTKNLTFINDANPNKTRGLININYTRTTPLTNILGGLEINNIIIDRLKEIQDRNINARYYSIYYDGTNPINEQTITNINIGNIKYINKDNNVNLVAPSSNIKMEKVYINTNQPTEIIKHNLGNKNLITIDRRTYYFVPIDNYDSEKTIFLRVQNTLKYLELNTKGLTNVIIDKIYSNTLFDKVFLNDVEIESETGQYNLGQYTRDTLFIIESIDNNIYVRTA